MKKKTNSPTIKGLLILFSLLVSVILSPSEFVDCQTLFPDENLDLSGISKVSREQSPDRKRIHSHRFSRQSVAFLELSSSL